MSKSFVPEDGDSINCPSTWQSNRSCQESSAQTADLTYVEKGSQSKSSSSAEVQTDSAGGISTLDVDMTKLAEWLTKITPRVLDELEKNRKSRVFDDYKLQVTSDESIKLMFSLNVEKDHPQYHFRTSAIDWSSTGGMFAISRCAREHVSWCEHSGCILLHQINRHESVVDSPHSSLDVSACVTTLRAHPSDSFILACGTFSGEVTVWNLQRDDPIVVGNITLHTEAVVHMEWVQNFDMMQTRPVLVSASRDGSIIIWTMKTVSGTLKPSLCFVLKGEKDTLDLGIVCTKFNPSRPTVFLVGLEGGSVAICSSDSRRPCIGKKSIGQDLDCYDPILNILDGHKGAVTGVQWVPGSKDLFLTCGTDSELRVYSSSELNLIRIIYLSEPSSGLDVCPSHPHVALTWGSSGAVELHNVYSGEKLPPLDIENDGFPVSAVRMRTASSQLLALGNADGKVSVWQIPHAKFTST